MFRRFDDGREEGWEEGRYDGWQSGRIEGFEEGRKVGIEEGREIGKREERRYALKVHDRYQEAGRARSFDDRPRYFEDREEEKESVNRNEVGKDPCV